MKKFLLLLLLPFFSLKADACSQARIFKIFPIGIQKDTIITIDFQIERNMLEAYNPEDKWSIKVANSDSAFFMWKLRSYICKYDKHQTLLSRTPVDSVCFLQDYYIRELRLMYTRALHQAKKDHQAYQLFVPAAISFCNFKYTCRNMSVKGEVIVYNGKNYVKGDVITYKGKDYALPVLKDSSYYGFKANTHLPDDLPPIGTVRRYVQGNNELVVVHFQRGEDLFKTSMPKVKFSNLATAVYDEPIQHHGYGFDLFILKK